MRSTIIARMAAGTAPCKTKLVSFSASPVTIGTPSPPAPIKAAKVAVPIFNVVAVRIPARIVGKAKGSLTDKKISMG